MKKLFMVLSLSFLVVACERTDKVPADRQSTRPDNTERNVRDRGGNTITPGDQSETEADRVITQKIRKALMEDDTLTTNAKNIKIITIREVVTLRGPVNSETEKAKIGQKAQQVNGVKKVDNFLEVSKP